MIGNIQVSRLCLLGILAGIMGPGGVTQADTVPLMGGQRSPQSSSLLQSKYQLASVRRRAEVSSISSTASIQRNLQQTRALPINDYPSFNSQRLDQQLRLYANYLATYGPPDVLVIGSSRSLQGIDPTVLEQALAEQGPGRITVFNFGINGATAQVVNLVLSEVLTPEQLPRMIVWADGSRALNSGRADVTYHGIRSSEGYRLLSTGVRPTLVETQTESRNETWLAGHCSTFTGQEADPSSVTTPNVLTDYRWTGWRSLRTLEPVRPAIREASCLPNAESESPTPRTTNRPQAGDLNSTGFQSVATTFDPSTYYRRFPRVAGQYDSNYVPFRMNGEQTTSAIAIAQFARENQIPLVFVNLPLTRDYLDSTRRQYEQQFRQHMEQLANQEGFIFIDLVQQWPTQNDYFADPSHLNQHGARAVAMHLATDPRIPWYRSLPSR